MHRESGSNQLVSRNVATLPHLLQGGGGIQESLVTVVIPLSAAPSNCGMTSHPTGMGWEGGWNQGAGCRLLLTLEEGTEVMKRLGADATLVVEAVEGVETTAVEEGEGELVEGAGEGEDVEGEDGAGAGGVLGDCFLRRKSSFLLWFLLRVEGLVLFLATGVAGVSFSWVAREKEKEEPMEREKVKDLPWLSSAWQNSRHLEAKVWSPPITTGVVIFLVYLK